jgi:hypothetical protein
MNKELPGAEFAKEHGYTLQTRAADYSSATYIKAMPFLCVDVIYLTVFQSDNDTFATLQRIIGMIDCKIGPFSMPGNFSLFEKQISMLTAG